MADDKTQGIIRLPIDVNDLGIEITCLVCGAYSGGTDHAKYLGDGVRILPVKLQEKPYICVCGTEYSTKFSADHWHLFANIPKELINKDALEAKLKKTD